MLAVVRVRMRSEVYISNRGPPRHRETQRPRPPPHLQRRVPLLAPRQLQQVPREAQLLERLGLAAAGGVVGAAHRLDGGLAAVGQHLDGRGQGAWVHGCVDGWVDESDKISERLGFGGMVCECVRASTW